MALPASRKVSDFTKILQTTASAAQNPGDVLAAFGALAGVVLGTEDKANGDSMSLALDGLWEIDCETGTTASAGDDAFFNTSTGYIVTAGGSNIIWVGTFAKAKTSGQLKATIDLNAPVSATTGTYIPSAAAQAMTTAGAVNLTSYYTSVNTTSGSGHASTLAAGVRVGQLKKIQLIVDGGDLVLTVSTLSGGNTITFADAGDYCLLQWNGSAWIPLELGNDADGATAPAISTV